MVTSRAWLALGYPEVAPLGKSGAKKTSGNDRSQKSTPEGQVTC